MARLRHSMCNAFANWTHRPTHLIRRKSQSWQSRSQQPSHRTTFRWHDWPKTRTRRELPFQRPPIEEPGGTRSTFSFPGKTREDHLTPKKNGLPFRRVATPKASCHLVELRIGPHQQFRTAARFETSNALNHCWSSWPFQQVCSHRMASRTEGFQLTRSMQPLRGFSFELLPDFAGAFSAPRGDWHSAKIKQPRQRPSD